MDQLSVNSVVPTAAEPSSVPAAPAVADRTLNQAVSAAVSKLNDLGYAGEGREVTFSLDRTTSQPVIKVINSATQEVIHQWPPEYLLQVAADNTNESRDSG